MKGFSVFGFQFSVFGFQFSVFGFQFSVVARSLVPSFPRSLVPLFLVPCSSFLLPRSSPDTTLCLPQIVRGYSQLL